MSTAVVVQPNTQSAIKDKNSRSGALTSLKPALLPLAAISLIFVMLVPLPAIVLDFLLAVSIAASIVVFLTAIQIRRAVDLSVFPTLLLLLTLFRLSLNIASSRRILLHGHDGMSAAGDVIEAFGQFVVGGNYVVGFVLFLALIAIQFLVVSHGAVRTAEVTARFTLDALPGKQMAIDADMNAGLIDETEARKRRQAIAREAEFYGAMDGAARFNQRDSVATILITAINIIAGLLIGTLQQGVQIGEALKTYTILTVGDGLVTMIPSLLVSVAGAITLTRANTSAGLESELNTQLFGKPTTLYIASAVAAGMCLIPGLPKSVFITVSIGLYIAGRRLAKRQAAESISKPLHAAPVKDEVSASDNIASLLKMEDCSLEIGFQLIPLVEEKQGGQLLGRVRTLRRHLTGELGFLIPPVHISDNLRLRPKEYICLLRGVEIGRWQVETNMLLAVPAGNIRKPISGKETREPAFGVNALWIDPKHENEAVSAGYSVADPGMAISTHLGELIRTHAWELLSRTEIKRQLDQVNETHPKLVEELIPKLLSLGEVQRVLQQLLRERVSIRDLGTILEALVEMASTSRALPALVEAARQSISRRLVRPYLDSDNTLAVLLLDPQLEDELSAYFHPDGARMLADGESRGQPALRRLLDSLKHLMGQQAASAMPVLLAPSPARYHIKRWLEPMVPKLVVLSPAELPPDVKLKSLGTVR